ncbi:MAG: Na+/H+ antiporter subunit E [Mycobacterium sp.]
MKLIRAALIRWPVFAGLWWLLTEGAGQWSYGIPIVTVLTGATLMLAPPVAAARRTVGVRTRALVRLLAWFVAHSVRGGVDVALRALRRPVDVAPVDMVMELRLQSPMGRVLLADLAALTPGSLSVDLADGKSGSHQLHLHVLHHELDVTSQLRQLERYLIDMLDPPDNGSTARR